MSSTPKFQRNAEKKKKQKKKKKENLNVQSNNQEIERFLNHSQ